MSLKVGERALELYYLKNIHSEVDTAIWLPQERVLFTAASVAVKRFGNHRPFVSIPDTLSAIKMMKALNPEIVIPGHGDPGTVKILDEMESYYNKLMAGVRQMVKQGKSLDEIKKELKIQGTEVGKARIALTTISKRRIAGSWADKRILKPEKVRRSRGIRYLQFRW